MNRFSAYLKKDGWILAAILFCAALCMLMGTQEEYAASTEESRISQVLSAIQGAGHVDVAVYYEDSVPCGAVVVAEGARDVAVQLRLTSAVGTLLGIDQERIAIYEREGSR